MPLAGAHNNYIYDEKVKWVGSNLAAPYYFQRISKSTINNL